jgi:hypothetical protein
MFVVPPLAPPGLPPLLDDAPVRELPPYPPDPPAGSTPPLPPLVALPPPEPAAALADVATVPPDPAELAGLVPPADSLPLQEVSAAAARRHTAIRMEGATCFFIL